MASVWDNSATIPYHPESGTCGPYSNDDMVAMVASMANHWGTFYIDESYIVFDLEEGVLGQVGVDNYDDYLYLGEAGTEDNAADGINPIIFDDDGEIIAEVAGVENQYLVLGFAGADGFSDDYSEITDGQAVFNCRCLTDHPSGPCYYDSQTVIDVTETEMQYTIMHEMGHFLNLEHSQTGIDKYVEDGSIDYLSIMFPIVVEGYTYFDIFARVDDISALAAMYPSETFMSDDPIVYEGEPWCKVTGTLRDVDGNELMCANVWAIVGGSNETTGYTVSATTGKWAYGTDLNDDGDIVDDGECEGLCGYYEIYMRAEFFTTFVIQPIEEAFIGGSSVGPCINGQNTSIDTDYFLEIEADECLPGQTLSLGEYTTAFTGGTGAGGDSETDSGGGGSSDGGASYDDLNPVGYWCALSPAALASPVSGLVCFMVVAAVLAAMRIRLKNSL